MINFENSLRGIDSLIIEVRSRVKWSKLSQIIKSKFKNKYELGLYIYWVKQFIEFTKN